MAIHYTPEMHNLVAARADELWREFDTLRQANASRLARYDLFEQEYNRPRDLDIPRLVNPDYGRGRVDPEDMGRHHIPLPFAHPIITKHAHRIAGRMPDILVPRRNNSMRERNRADTIEKILYSVHRLSQSDVQIASGAHHASHLGACAFDIRYDFKRQMPKFRELHPGSVLPVFGVDDPMDFERCYRYWHVSKESFIAKYGQKPLPGHISRSTIQCDPERPDQYIIVEMWDRTQVVRFTCGAVLDQPVDHNYDFVPFVVVPNLGPAERIWGYSDYEFVRGIIAYLEATLSRQADNYRLVANGATVDNGTGHAPDKVADALKKGKVITSKKEGKLTAYQPAQFGSEIINHLDMFRTSLNDIGFTPPAAWGDIGAATSGSDRAMQLGPQIELTALKQIHWNRGLQRLHEFALRLIESKQIASANYTGTHRRGLRSTAFAITLDAAATAEVNLRDDNNEDVMDSVTGLPVTIPATPKELIDGEYDTELIWNNRIDRDDPNFVLSEINKFAQATQSLYTTLERLGVTNPEEEIRLIDEEAQKYPWLRSGMIALLEQQFQSESQASGQPASAGGGGDPSAALAMLQGGGGAQTGALNFDAQSRALNGGPSGGSRTSGVPGSPNGGA